MDLQVILKYPVVCLVGFLTVYLLTPVARALAPRLGMMDHPESRRVHSRSIPRGGGVSLFLGFHAVCAAVFLLPWASFAGQLDLQWWQHFAVLSTILLAVGLIDDIWDIKPLLKLAGQTFVAILAFGYDIRVGKLLGIPLPLMVDMAATVFWFLAIINAFNLIDGIDGLATGLASIAAVGMGGAFLFRHLSGDALIMFGLVGCCLAFLRYNFHPATIFLGDSGSMFLGFTIAAIALSTGAKGTAVTTIGVPLLAVGIPLFDTMLAVWRRAVRHAFHRNDQDKEQAKGSILKADLDHLHHRLLKAGLSQRAAATWLYGLAIGLVVIGLLSMIYHSHALGIYVLAFVVATYIVVKHLARTELWDSGRAIVQGLARPPSRVLAVILYPPVDILTLAGAFAAALFFSGQDWPPMGFRRFWFDQIPLWVGIPFISLFAARTYKRVWSRARISEYVVVGIALMTGILTAAGLAGILEKIDAASLLRRVVIYAGISIPFIAGIRTFPRVVQDMMASTRRHHIGEDKETRRILVYGAGYQATLFLREISFTDPEEQQHRHVVGLIDEDRNLHGRFVHGFPVLGGLESIPDVVALKKVDEIVIATAVDEDVRDSLLETAKRCNVALTEWKTVLVHLTDPVCDPKN